MVTESSKAYYRLKQRNLLNITKFNDLTEPVKREICEMDLNRTTWEYFFGKGYMNNSRDKENWTACKAK